MTIFSRCLLATLLVTGAMLAKADTILWTLNDVVFSDGDTAQGWFETNSTNLNEYINEFSITVTGPDTALDFTANAFDYAALPTEIGFALDPGFSPYVDLNVAGGGLTTAGGTFSLTSGFLCGNCPTLDTNGYNPTVTGVVGGVPPDPPAVPEPAGLPLLGAGMLGILAVLRRKVVRVS